MAIERRRFAGMPATGSCGIRDVPTGQTKGMDFMGFALIDPALW
jgi:hypothetical protein